MQNLDNTARKDWLGLMARSPDGAISTLFSQPDHPDFEWLRPPEFGSVMVRGRTGATGAAFNLGEMTVTRCSVKLTGGEVGHGYVQGRRKADAQAAALVDALMQTQSAAHLQETVLDPLQADMQAKKQARAEKAAATKVDFFTMVRGED